MHSAGSCWHASQQSAGQKHPEPHSWLTCLPREQDAKELLYKLFKAGFVTLQDVPRTADHAPSRTLFTWSVSNETAAEKLAAELYKAAFNVYVRSTTEFEQHKEVSLPQCLNPLQLLWDGPMLPLPGCFHHDAYCGMLARQSCMYFKTYRCYSTATADLACQMMQLCCRYLTCAKTTTYQRPFNVHMANSLGKLSGPLRR